MAESLIKLDPYVSIKGDKQHLMCGHCGNELSYKTEESNTLSSYVVYRCLHCQKDFNDKVRYPRLVGGNVNS